MNWLIGLFLAASWIYALNRLQGIEDSVDLIQADIEDIRGSIRDIAEQKRVIRVKRQKSRND
jgi:predicted ATP-grasp superfamily ATP-dependent carboligase